MDIIAGDEFKDAAYETLNKKKVIAVCGVGASASLVDIALEHLKPIEVETRVIVVNSENAQKLFNAAELKGLEIFNNIIELSPRTRVKINISDSYVEKNEFLLFKDSLEKMEKDLFKSVSLVDDNYKDFNIKSNRPKWMKK